MIRIGLLLLISMAGVAHAKPRVALTFSNAWSGPIRASLSKSASLKVVKAGPPAKLCRSTKSDGLLLFAKGKGKKPGAVTIWSCSQKRAIERVSLTGKPPKKKGKLPKGIDSALQEAVAQLEARAAPEPPKPPPVAEEPPLAQLEAPPASESEVPSGPPEPQAEGESADDQVEERPQRAVAASDIAPLRIRAASRFLSRQLRFTDDLFQQLSTHTLPVGPAIGAELEVFPAAFVSSGFARQLGLRALFTTMVGVGARTPSGGVFRTSSIDLQLMAVLQLRLGRLSLQPQAGYSQLSFAFVPASSETVRPNIPDVNYGSIRLGTAAEFLVFGPLSVLAEAHYRMPLSAGELSTTYFPRLTGAGMDASLGARLLLANHFEIRLVGEYTRMAFSLRPEPGDPYIAGGALDVWQGAGAYVGYQW